MKVRAISDGFYKGARRRAGSEFEFDGEPAQMGKWMEDAAGPATKGKKKPLNGDTKNAATRGAVDAKIATLGNAGGEPPGPLA